MGAGAGAASSFVSLAVTVVSLAGMWKMYEKAGKPGWAAIIPIYNIFVLFDIVYGNGIKFLTLLIPIYNIYVAIKLYIDLAKRFGQPTAFALGLIFLSPIFMAILGFGDAQYSAASVEE